MLFKINKKKELTYIGINGAEIVKKMNDKGMNAHYVYTERSDGLLPQLGRAIRSNRNLGEVGAVHTIEEAYDRSDGQYNLIGYSMGSVDVSYAAIRNAKEGKVIDNLVLIGSPINDDSRLMKNVRQQKNIKNVIRYDISGDLLAPDVSFNVKKWVKNGSGQHFYYTENNEGQQDSLVNELYEQNIR